MTDITEWKERRDQVARDLVASLLRDNVSELEADPTYHDEMDEQGTATSDLVIEPGVIEFYGRTVSCLVRKLSKTGAALDMVKPSVVPDHFTLAFPLEGTSYRCRLVWRREAEMGVAFQ
jgi:hypothetical protein